MKKIFEVLSGSRAYGTQTPTSDIDIRGIYLEGPDVMLSVFKNEFRDEIHVEGEDTKYFELRKFMSALYENKIFALEMLFSREDAIQQTSDVAQFLINNRDQFLSKKSVYHCKGHAESQFKRMTNRSDWMEEIDPPRVIDFTKIIHSKWKKIPDSAIAIKKSDDHLFLYDPARVYVKPSPWYRETEIFISEPKKINSIIDEPDAIVFIKKKELQQAKEKYRNYKEWKEKRNPEKTIIEKRFGYNPKEAMHAIRLMRMAHEIIETNTLNVFRSDFQELLEIRSGKYSIDEIKSMFLKELEWIDNHVDKTNLPESPECPEIVNQIIQQAYSEYWQDFWMNQSKSRLSL